MCKQVLLERRWQSSRRQDENYWVLKKDEHHVLCEYRHLIDASGEDDEWDNDSFKFPIEDAQQCLRQLDTEGSAKLILEAHSISFQTQGENLTVFIKSDKSSHEVTSVTLQELIAALGVE